MHACALLTGLGCGSAELDWEQRYENPPGPDQMFLPGTLSIADHGCTLGPR